MAAVTNLTTKQFALIEDLLPARGKRGGRRNDYHATLNGIVLVALQRGAVARGARTLRPVAEHL